jgi:hypothetical protein
MLEHVAVDVDLLILHGVHDLGRHVDLVGEIGLHRRHADARRRIDERDGRGDLAERIDGPFELVDVVEVLVADDALGFFGLAGQLGDPFAREVAEGQLQVPFPFFQVALLGELPEPVQLLGHPPQHLLEEVLAEVPVVHLQIDVFLDDGMAGGTEHGSERGQAEVGFGGIPIRRKDQHHVDLSPAGCLLGGAPMELYQFLGGLRPLGVLHAHGRESPARNVGSF